MKGRLEFPATLSAAEVCRCLLSRTVPHMHTYRIDRVRTTVTVPSEPRNKQKREPPHDMNPDYFFSPLAHIRPNVSTRSSTRNAGGSGVGMPQGCLSLPITSTSIVQDR